MQKTLGLAGKKILVTGAGGFLGSLICDMLKFEAVRVIGVDVYEKPNVISNTSGSYSISKLDITDKKEVCSFAKSIGLDGYLDGVVNNAAVNFKGNSNTPKEFTKTMDVNVEGTHNCITQFKDVLAPDASIVNVASVYGLLSPDFRIYNNNEQLYSSSAYGASKAAIIQMTKYYAAQLAPTRINAISPGGIFQGHDDSFVAQYSERVPMKRMANPEEIVSAILFLLSPMSSYITGHNLIVDGGLSAW